MLPVKAPQNAQQRLSGLLTAAQRETLARAMYEHVLAALCAARGIDRIVVATSDASTADHARRRGALVFDEREQISHSHSADAAARRARDLGATTVLLLPIDAALATPADIEQLAGAARPGVVIVPSADGAGTNALALTPPDVIETRFGKDSFQAHLHQARSKDAPVEVLRPPGLVFDLDTPADVAQLLAQAPDCPIAQLLAVFTRPQTRVE